MGAEEVPNALSGRLHALLDSLPVADRAWPAARPDLRRRLRHRRLRQLALAGTAVVVAIAFATVIGARASRPQPPVAAGQVRLYPLAAVRVFGTRDALPSLLAYGDGRLFAAVQSGSQPAGLLRLDPARLRVTGRIGLSGAPAGLAFGHGTLWILGVGQHQLLGIDPVTMRTVSHLPLPGPGTALAYGDGALWGTVCCTRTPDGHRLRLVRIDPATGRATSSGGLPGSGGPASLAVGQVILVSSDGSPVLAVDPRTLVLRRTFHVNCDGCSGDTGIAAGPNALYAVSINQVVRLNLGTGGIAAAGPQLPFAFTGALEAASGRLWLGTDQGTFELNPATLAPVARLVTGGGLDLLGTGDTSQVLMAGGSAYASYPGGIARYPDPEPASPG